jgi:hypothetical protein
MSFGNYLENELLDHVFGMGGADYTSPATIYVGLGTSDPGEAGTAWGEPWGIGTYARVVMTQGDFSAASDGSTTNANAETFVEAGAAWGSIAYYGLFTAGSAGNYLGGGALTSMKYIDSGDTPRFAAGDMDITLA